MDSWKITFSKFGHSRSRNQNVRGPSYFLQSHFKGHGSDIAKVSGSGSWARLYFVELFALKSCLIKSKGS